MLGLGNLKACTIFILFLVFLQGCGGDSEPSKATVEIESSAEIKQVEKTPSSDTTSTIKLVPFDYQARSLKGKLRRNEVVSQSQLNSVGKISSPSIQSVVRGNLTVAASGISDPDGINKLYLGFSGASQAQVLCEQDCSDSVDVFQTGVNPHLFSQEPGSIVLEIWLEDRLGQLSIAASQQITWLPKSVVINDEKRANGVATISWAELPDYLRYNVYLASEPIDNPTKISQLNESQFVLSLAQKSHSFSGLDTKKNYYVKVTAIDGSGESAFSENRLLQASEILIPDVNDDAFNLEQFGSVTGNVLDNDNDRGVGPLIVTLTPIRAPQNGSVEISNDGTFTYQPTGSFYGKDSFRYRVTNAQGVSAEADVTLTIEKINVDPVALYNQFIIKQDTLFDTVNGGLLVNDFDLDGDQLSVETTPVVTVSNGALTIQSNGNFSYQPNEGFVGEDSFVYRVLDGQGGTHTAQVDLVVMAEPQMQALIAINDNYQTDEDIVLSEPPLGVFANDILDEQSEIIVSIYQATAQGSLELTNQGEFRYSPSENFFGTDYFIYEITDQFGNKAAAFVQLVINSVNDAPIANDDFAEVAQGDSLTIDVLENDIDIDGLLDPASIEVVEQAIYGSVKLNADGTGLIYQSQTDYKGSDFFAYTVQDKDGLTSNTAYVYLEVTGENLSPLAVNDIASTYQGEQISINILANDSDQDGSINNASIEIITQPSNGTVEVSPVEFVLLYTPNTDFEGTDLIQYKVRDNLGKESNTATVEIQVMKRNTSPISENDVTQVEIGSSISINILNNDVDPDGTLNLTSVRIMQQPTAGQVLLNSVGIAEYQHLADTTGQDIFTYQVADNEGAYSNTATVVINIVAPDTTPITNNDTAQTNKNEAVSIAVLANDDNRGQVLDLNSFEFIEMPSNGGVEFNSDTKNVIYTPNNNFVGTDTFSYLVSNSLGEQSNTSNVNIEVVYKNYAPLISSGSAAIKTDLENGDIVFQVEASDPDEDTLTYELTDITTLQPLTADDVFVISSTGLITVNNSDLLMSNGERLYQLEVSVCDSGSPSLCNSTVITVEVTLAQTIYTAEIDTNFANSGILPVQLRASLEYHLTGESIQLSDGSTLIASGVGSYDSEQSRNIHRAAITKVNMQGIVDKTFALYGVFSSDFGILVGGLKQNIVAVNLMLGSDNKVYVTGYVDKGTEQDLLLFRLSINGQLDQTYGALGTGYIQIPSEDNVKATPVSMALEGDVVTIVYNNELSGVTTANLTRVTSDGNVSNSTALNSGTYAKGFIKLPTEHYLLFGTTPSPTFDKDLLFVKISSSNLAIDLSFQESGYLQIDLENAAYDNTVYDLTLLADNHLIATGSTVLGTSGQKSVYLLKMDTNGSLVSEFGTLGLKTFQINELPTSSDPMVDLSLYDATGIAVNEVSGSLYISISRTQYDFGYAVQVFKVNELGEMDSNWVPDLLGLTIFESSGVQGKGVIINDALMTIFGYKQKNLGYNYFADQWLASIDLSGSINTDFGSLGQVDISSGSANERAIAAMRNASGTNVVISGDADSWQGEAVPYVLKIDSQGKRDMSFANAGLTQMGFYSSATNTAILENADLSVLIAGKEGSSAFLGKFNNTGNIDTGYGLSEGKKYLSASEFGATDPASTINITQLYNLPTGNTLGLALLYDGCIEQTLGLHLNTQGEVLTHFLFTPPEGYSCNSQSLQIQHFYTTSTHLFGVGQDGQTYSEPRLILAKVDLQGQLDLTFGTAGIAAIDIGASAGQRLNITGYIVDANDNFIVYGRIDDENFIARVNSEGAIDTNFASNGVYKFEQLAGESTTLKKLWQQSSSELLLFAQSNTTMNVQIARLLSLETPGALDTSFNQTGSQLFASDLSAELVDVVNTANTESFVLILQGNDPQRVEIRAGLIEPN